MKSEGGGSELGRERRILRRVVLGVVSGCQGVQVELGHVGGA